MKRKLHIDIETYSDVNLLQHGVYKYSETPEFKVLLFAYAWDDEPVQIIDLTETSLPSDLRNALTDDSVEKWAHNAQFERVCLSRYLGLPLDTFLSPEAWRCSAALAAMCGLPRSLAGASEALGLSEKKMGEGKELIQLFSIPRQLESNIFTDTAAEATIGRVTRQMNPEAWKVFMDYCKQDVEVERAIANACHWYPIYEEEQAYYVYDQLINDRGVRIDMNIVGKTDLLLQAKEDLVAQARKITGLTNPNSVSALKTWLSDQLGEDISSLRKEDFSLYREKALQMGRHNVVKVIDLRSMMGKASNAKYVSMGRMAGVGDRARGCALYYGTHTGRWAGRGIQLQNIPQNHIKSLDEARQMLSDGDFDSMELVYGDVQGVASQLIRTALIPSDGCKFAVCDFSAIEARVLAWIAGEDWVLDVFRGGGDIYCATASQMFGVPVEKHGQNAELRQKGKVAVLALGYQGGVSALDRMGGARMGLTEDEEKGIVSMWRETNPKIVQLWSHVQTAVETVCTYGGTKTLRLPYTSISFQMQDDTLCITLPSGRVLSFYKMRRENDKLAFSGLDESAGVWKTIDTFGGKLVNNITQATARDCLAVTLERCERSGYPVVFHVHDELVMEVPADRAKGCLKDIERIFSLPAEWNYGLPLKGAGYLGDYYFKD